MESVSGPFSRSRLQGKRHTRLVAEEAEWNNISEILSIEFDEKMGNDYTHAGRVIILISLPFLVLGSSKFFITLEVDAFCIIGSIVFVMGFMSFSIGWSLGD
jgi:hypothetical protein